MSKGLWDLAITHLIFPVNKMYFFGLSEELHHSYPFTALPGFPYFPRASYHYEYHLTCDFFAISAPYKSLHICLVYL